MNSELEILEISSDEEGIQDEDDDDSHDWLSELLGSEDSEGSEDVVILNEDSCSSTLQKKDCVASDVVGVGSGNDSDDDCLVLDGDPDNPVSVVDRAADESDDLLVVGEKGQLACRDYPHPRHLCVEFPFSSTPHEKHCHLCHCYVCDSLAPCIYWGTGLCFTDHCNSTDKEEVWKNQRRCFKQSNVAAPPVHKLPDTALSMRVPLHNTQPPQSFSEPLSIRLISRKMPVSQSVGPARCSMTNFGTNGNRRLNPHLRFARNRYPQYESGSIQLLPRVRTNTRERGAASASGPQFNAPYSRFKRPGTPASAFPMLNRSGRGLYDSSRIYTASEPRNQSIQATPDDAIQLKKCQDLLHGIDSELDAFLNTSSPNSNCNSTNFQFSVTSQPQVEAYEPSFPQFESNQNMNQFGNPAPNSTGPDLLSYSWPLNGMTRSTPVDPTLSSALLLEPPTFIETQGEHLQNSLGSLELHEENWLHNTMQHQHPIPETASTVLSDLDFLSLQSSLMDSLFCDLEDPWVL